MELKELVVLILEKAIEGGLGKDDPLFNSCDEEINTGDLPTAKEIAEALAKREGLSEVEFDDLEFILEQAFQKVISLDAFVVEELEDGARKDALIKLLLDEENYFDLGDGSSATIALLEYEGDAFIVVYHDEIMDVYIPK